MSAVINLKINKMNKVELIHAEVSAEYCKKWNISPQSDDFMHLYVNGVKKSDTLYRIGGFGTNLKEPYFMILKQVESIYDKHIMEAAIARAKKDGYKGDNNPRYLANCSCIIDNNGDERKVFNSFDSPYLQGGLIYSLNKSYHNIETGEVIADYIYFSMESYEFLFLDNSYDKDKSRRGVMKVNKNDGSFEIFFRT